MTVLTSSRYGGVSPKQLVPQLADEGLYLASESTMYRVQRRLGLCAKKQADGAPNARAARVHRAPVDATEPGLELGHHWLRTIVRGSYLYLYLIMDVWSRRIVGWRIAELD